MIHIRASRELIDKYLTSYDIFSFYCSGFTKLGKKFKSDIRTGDKDPSASIIYYRNDLLYTDFGRQGSYRAIDYVARRFNISYYDALQKIAEDFGLLKVNQNQVYHKIKYESKELNITYKEKTPSIIQIKSQDFTKADLEYWNNYYWTEYMLNVIGVKSISHFFITNESKDMNNQIFYTQNTLSFSFEYYWLDGIFRRKLYFPHREKEYRFLTNGGSSIVQGWDTLPKKGGDTLFITSSLKDIGPFWRLGYYAIAPNSERLFIPNNVWRKLKQRWKRIIIWYDNDNTGINDAKRFAAKYDVEYYYNPLRAPKDPSDFVKTENLREFNWLIQNYD